MWIYIIVFCVAFILLHLFLVQYIKICYNFLFVRPRAQLEHIIRLGNLPPDWKEMSPAKKRRKLVRLKKHVKADRLFSVDEKEEYTELLEELLIEVQDSSMN